MTPEQRYLLDLQGYLHLPGLLSGTELTAARDAVERMQQTPADELPPGIDRRGLNFSNGFSFDPALERLALHPSTWPIVRELTAARPRLASGTVRINTNEDSSFFGFHCALASPGQVDWPRYDVREGRLFCDMFVVFFYFDDVREGDGGLVVIPGSHKTQIERPETLFQPASPEEDPAPHPAFTNVLARAGDAIVLTELTTHGALAWKPADRNRAFVMLRYAPQYVGSTDGNLPFPIPPEVTSRLLPQTQELIEFTTRDIVKEIVERDRPLD